MKVINLARSPKRRARMEAQLRTLGLPYDFVEGVDGRELRLPDPELVDPALLSRSWFRPGVVGCALSHCRAYESVIADDLDRALILEDDVILPEDIASLAECVGQLMTGPEVVLLNFHTEQTCKLVRHSSIALPHGRQLVSPLDVDQLTGAVAYVVTRDACLRMIGVNRPVSFRADDWGLWTESGAVEMVRCVVPVAIPNDLGFVSDMDYYPPKSLHGRLQRLARYRVPLLYQAAALRRGAIDRRRSRLEYVDVVCDPPGLGNGTAEERTGDSPRSGAAGAPTRAVDHPLPQA